MCGIAGGEKGGKLIEHLEHRGSSQNSVELENFALGHTLHSVVGDVEQPLEGEGVLVANCEIYNWKSLAEEYGFEVRNDAELLLKLLDEEGVCETLEIVDGVYAFAYLRGEELFLARDLLGLKPIWYSKEPFAFASERQALESEGFEYRELHPRQVLRYDLETGKIEFKKRDFFEIEEFDKDIDEAAEEVKELFLEAVEKRIPDGEVALLFSGGVDSTMVAAALKRLDVDFTCYTSGIRYGNVNAPRDVEWAEKIAGEMDIELEVFEAGLEDVEGVLPEISDWISSTSVVKLGVALPFHFALQGDEKVVLSGIGSEQLYAGYSRMKQGYLNDEGVSGLRSVFHRDLYRDDVVSMRNGYELRAPFLDHELVENAFTISEDLKVREGYRKYVVRKAAEKLGVPEDVVWRKKVAAQYGSNFDKAIDKLAGEKGFDHKQEYLNGFRDTPDNRLAALTSGGKDSNAALYRMKRRNNEISCLVHLESRNKESYMFDSRKEVDVIREQAEELGTPLIVRQTEGEKEEELDDLERALKKAVEKHDIEGVVAGALASSYQRDRVEQVCENLGLKAFTPLWMEDQERYMRWLVREGFKVEITSVAARGLAESWEGRILDEDKVEELIELSREYGFNAAGEGGEYETRLIEFP